MLKASVDYYGPCRSPETHGTVPLLVLAGEDDTWGDPARTCRHLGELLQPDQPFELHTYTEVVHAFDNPRLSGRRMVEGHPMQYDEAAAGDSFVHVKTFLDRYVGHP